MRARVGRLLTFIAGGLAATLAGVATKLVWDGLADRVVVADGLVGVLLILAVITLITVQLAASGKVDTLIEKASFSIRYCSADDPERLYLHCRDVINQADPDIEIYAVNSCTEVLAASNEPSHESAQRGYLAAFERRFSSVRYHRLIQVRNDQWTTDLAPAYRDHYREMALFAEKNPSYGIKLDEVPARLPTSFVVVKNRDGDGGQIIWQLSRNEPGADQPEVARIMGALVIEDPDALLVPRFLQWFDELDRNSRELTPDRLRAQS